MILEELEVLEGKGRDIGWQTATRLSVLGSAYSNGTADPENGGTIPNGGGNGPQPNGGSGNHFFRPSPDVGVEETAPSKQSGRLKGMMSGLSLRDRQKQTSLLPAELEMSHEEPGLTRSRRSTSNS